MNLQSQDENTTSSLMKIINRAQAELRSKTNIVLESTFREQPQTLPLIYPEQAKEVNPPDNRLKHPPVRKKVIKRNLEVGLGNRHLLCSEYLSVTHPCV